MRGAHPHHWARRVAALWVWCAAVWLLLTWTVTAEQVVFGAVLSAVVAAALAPFGDVAAPWALIRRPGRLVAVTALVADSLWRIVRANVSLARRIWSPRLPLRSGMIIVSTRMRTDGEVAAVGLISSLIVDNQIVDLDRSEDQLQYHAVDVPDGDDDQRVASVNGPTERRIIPITRAS